MGPELAWNMYEAIRLSDNKVGVRIDSPALKSQLSWQITRAKSPEKESPWFTLVVPSIKSMRSNFQLGNQLG